MTTLLSDSDLAGLDTTIGETLGDVAKVLRQSRTSDSMGGFTTTFTVVATEVPVRIVEGDLSLQTTGDRRVRGRQSRATVPRGTDVALGDRLEVTGGDTWTVLTIPASPRSALVMVVSRVDRDLPLGTYVLAVAARGSGVARPVTRA